MALFKPLPALIPIGAPVLQLKIPESCHPPTIWFTRLLELLRNIRFVPKGRSQPPNALMVWRRWNVSTPFCKSRFRGSRVRSAVSVPTPAGMTLLPIDLDQV